jgi:predicted TIM-barrel fold metal-dependent hydrolase
VRRFDVHQHLVPPAVQAALRARNEPPRLRAGTLELREGAFAFDARAHDLGARVALLDRDGIDVAVVSLPPTLETEEHPELGRVYDESVLETVSAAGGRLRALAAGRCLPGFAGACVSAGALVAGLGELPRELAADGQVLFVHPGPPSSPPAGAPPWWAPVVDYTSQMQAAYFGWTARDAERHPDLRIVFAILAGGAAFQLERLRARGPALDPAPPDGVYFDTACYGRRALALALEAFGPERLVYGSDVPVVDSRTSLQAMAGLGEAVVATVSSRNPARLFR